MRRTYNLTVINLVCGCRAKSRDYPSRAGQTYACQGTGHGYTVHWVSYIDVNGVERFNHKRLEA
jgi:hypothetical protein